MSDNNPVSTKDDDPAAKMKANDDKATAKSATNVGTSKAAAPTKDTGKVNNATDPARTKTSYGVEKPKFSVQPATPEPSEIKVKQPDKAPTKTDSDTTCTCTSKKKSKLAGWFGSFRHKDKKDKLDKKGNKDSTTTARTQAVGPSGIFKVSPEKQIASTSKQPGTCMLMLSSFYLLLL